MSKAEIRHLERNKQRAQGFITRRRARCEEECTLWLREVAQCDAAIAELAEDEEGDFGVIPLEKSPEPRYEDDLASICEREVKG